MSCCRAQRDPCPNAWQDGRSSGGVHPMTPLPDPASAPHFLGPDCSTLTLIACRSAQTNADACCARALRTVQLYGEQTAEG